jgi:hypothetical protein
MFISLYGIRNLRNYLQNKYIAKPPSRELIEVVPVVYVRTTSSACPRGSEKVSGIRRAYPVESPRLERSSVNVRRGDCLGHKSDRAFCTGSHILTVSTRRSHIS